MGRWIATRFCWSTWAKAVTVTTEACMLSSGKHSRKTSDEAEIICHMPPSASPCCELVVTGFNRFPYLKCQTCSLLCWHALPRTPGACCVCHRLLVSRLDRYHRGCSMPALLLCTFHRIFLIPKGPSVLRRYYIPNSRATQK